MPPRCVSLALALVALSACAGHAIPGRSRAGYPLLWHEGTLRDARGLPAWTPPGRLLVELLPDGSVRDASGGPIAGFPSPEGFSLYAKRLVEVHLGSIEGPSIGTASAGYRFKIASYERDVTEIAVPGFGEDAAPVRAFVWTHALAVDAKEAPPSPRPGSVGVTGVDVALHLTPGGPVFTKSGCEVLLLDEARSAETGRRWIKVALDAGHYPGSSGELTLVGWADAVDFEASSSCGAGAIIADPEVPLERVRRLFPPGFAELPSLDAPPFGDKARFHWLMASSDGAACMEMSLGDKKVSGSWLNGDTLRTTEYGYGYNSTSRAIVLTGPNFMVLADRGQGPVLDGGGFSCAHGYTVIGARPEGLAVIHGAHFALPPRKLWAYRPAEVEVWYRSGDMCQRDAASKQGASPLSVSEGGRVRFHQGC